MERVNLANHSDKQNKLPLLSCPAAAPHFAPWWAVQPCSVFSAAVQHLEIAISLSTSERYENIFLGRVHILESAAANFVVSILYR